MIRHCVFLNLRANHDATELGEVLDGLAALCATLPDASGFLSGPNRDFESKSPEFAAGFTIDFTDHAALETYAAHPEHLALGGRLVAQCRNGADGITVFDIESV